MLFGRCESQLWLVQLQQVSMYVRFHAEMFSRTSSHICGTYVWVINMYYDCGIAHPRVPCKICNSFFSSKELLDQHIASSHNSSVSCYCFVTQQGVRCSCHYVLWYMVEQHN